MSRVPGQEDPALAHPVGDLHPRRPGIGGQHGRPGWHSGRGVDDPAGLTFAGAVVDTERDDPPGVRRIERADQRGRVGVDDPVVDRRAVPDVRPQAGRPEDHPEVRPERVLAHVGGTDALPDCAARAVASDQVGARHDGALAVPGGDRDPDLVAVLLDVHDRGPGHQRARG